MTMFLKRFLKLWKRIRNRYLTLFEGVESPEMRCDAKWSRNFSKHFEMIKNRFETSWNRSESLLNALKTVKIYVGRTSEEVERGRKKKRTFLLNRICLLRRFYLVCGELACDGTTAALGTLRHPHAVRNLPRMHLAFQKSVRKKSRAKK